MGFGWVGGWVGGVFFPERDGHERERAHSAAKGMQISQPVNLGKWVGGWVGGWVGARKVEKDEAVRMSYCGIWEGGWAGGVFS